MSDPPRPVYVVDTSVWARVPLSRPVRDRLAAIHRAHEIVTATPIGLEMGFSARNPADWDATMSAMHAFRVLHPNPTTHRTALGLQRALWHRGAVRAAGAFDTLTAAVAMEHDAIVLHYDRDFVHLAAVEPRLRQEWVAEPGSL